MSNNIESELNLQIHLGCMDHRSGRLTSADQQILAALMVGIRKESFFTGRDDYLQYYGVEAAVGRFRRSRLSRMRSGNERTSYNVRVLSDGKIINIPKIKEKIYHYSKIG